MTAVAFDTHETIKRLTTGKGAVSKETAEKLVSVMKTTRDDLATANDIALIRKDMEALEVKLTGRIDALDVKVNGRIDAMFWRLAALFIIANGALVYALRTVVQL